MHVYIICPICNNLPHAIYIFVIIMELIGAVKWCHVDIRFVMWILGLLQWQNNAVTVQFSCHGVGNKILCCYCLLIKEIGPVKRIYDTPNHNFGE